MTGEALSSSIREQAGRKMLSLSGKDFLGRTYTCEADITVPAGQGDFYAIYRGSMQYPENGRRQEVALKVLQPNMQKRVEESLHSWQDMVDEHGKQVADYRKMKPKLTGLVDIYADTTVDIGDGRLRPALIREWFREMLDTAHMTPADVGQMVADVGKTLDGLNEADPQIIYTDISPGNIGIRENGDYVISDFGSYVRPGDPTRLSGCDMRYAPLRYVDEMNNTNTLYKERDLSGVVFSLAMMAYIKLGGVFRRRSDVDELMMTAPVIQPAGNITPQVIEVLRRATGTFGAEPVGTLGDGSPYWDLYDPKPEYATASEFARELNRVL